MKTLNLNKLIILLGLFVVTAFFTTTTNAACVVNGAGAIVTDYADNGGGPVQEDVASEDFDLDTQYNSCLVTPDEYKMVFYKYGICKADPSFGDISSCAFLFDFPAGIEHDIEKDVVEALPIPEFAIEPGSYPFSYVLLSNEIGMKWKAQMSASTDGVDAGGVAGAGLYCWTSGKGPTSSSYQTAGGALVETVHGDTLTQGAAATTIDCGGAAGVALFNYEIIPRFSEGLCSAALAANGDRTEFGAMGVGQGVGIPTVSLLTAADVFAADCQTAAKIAWTTTLDVALTVTENSSYLMSIQATDANTMFWADGDNNDISMIESGAPLISLIVTD